eukprot:scaffold692_cov78-Phaeocystis_antarctica.AAC.5
MYIVEVVASCVSAAEVAPAYGPRVVDGRVETVSVTLTRYGDFEIQTRTKVLREGSVESFLTVPGSSLVPEALSRLEPRPQALWGVGCEEAGGARRVPCDASDGQGRRHARRACRATDAGALRCQARTLTAAELAPRGAPRGARQSTETDVAAHANRIYTTVAKASRGTTAYLLVLTNTPPPPPPLPPPLLPPPTSPLSPATAAKPAKPASVATSAAASAASAAAAAAAVVALVVVVRPGWLAVGARASAPSPCAPPPLGCAQASSASTRPPPPPGMRRHIRRAPGSAASSAAPPEWSKAVESATLKAAGSSSRGSGWVLSGSASFWEYRAELPRAARRGLRRHRSRARALPRLHFDHAAPRPAARATAS